jgi:Tfp pilus assembly protein PilO
MKTPNPKIFMVLTGVSLLAGMGLCYMQYNALGEVNTNRERLRAEAKDEKEVQAELATAKTELAEIYTKISHLEQGVSEWAYVPTLLKELEKTGQTSGLQVLGVRPIPKTVKPTMVSKKDNPDEATITRKPYNEQDIEIRCRGDYRSVMNFTKALQMFPKIVAARTVSLQPKSGAQTPGSPQLEAVIELRAYLFPTDGSLKKASEHMAEPAEKTINVSGRNKVIE